MVSGIPNIIKDLSDDLKTRVEAVIQLTEALEDTQSKLDLAKRDLKRVQIALEALSGNDIPIPANAESGSLAYSPSDPGRPAQTRPEPQPAPVQAPVVPQGPVCNACGGTMIYMLRELNNGKKVNLWSCRECRNERF